MSKIETNSEFDAEEVGEVFAEVNRRTIEAQAARIAELEDLLHEARHLLDAALKTKKQMCDASDARIAELEAQVKALREAAIDEAIDIIDRSFRRDTTSWRVKLRNILFSLKR